MSEWELAHEQQPGNPERPEELKQAEQPPHNAKEAKREAEAGALDATQEHPGIPNSGIAGGATEFPNAGRTAEQLENLVKE